ncbi:hypothetical protein QBC41DRAFT_377259 [Cercophora samala]|uniref:Uncharacterized protein n=1 Tax=Cercophora samala TaxID=330535 RepID=A0AA40D4B9_9PEZI|nr:hypothetical protein QBC41DRAFT_377259 [Cercophora samala]
MNAKFLLDSDSSPICEIITEVQFEYVLDKAIVNISDGHISKQRVAFELALHDELGRVIERRLGGNRQRLNSIWQELEETGNTSAAREQLRSLLSRLRVHPHLLNTLVLLAKIKVERGYSRGTTSLEMLDVVHKWRARMFGSSHDLTLAAEFDHAIATRENKHNFREAQEAHREAREKFRQVMIERARRLGKSHIDTLAAKREFVTTCCGLLQWEDPDAPDFAEPKSPSQPADGNTHENTTPQMTLDHWILVESCFHKIKVAQESQLGAAHPETITTLFWMFTIQLMTGKITEASKTRGQLLERLRRPWVLKQRPLKALQTEERIAWICLMHKQPADALGILQEITRCGTRELSKAIGPSIDGSAEEREPEMSRLVDACQLKIKNIKESSEPLLRQTFERYIELRDTQLPSRLDAEIYLANSLMLASVLEDRTSIISEVRSEAMQRLNQMLDKAEEISGNNNHSSDGELLSSIYLLLSAALPQKDELDRVWTEVQKQRGNTDKVKIHRQQREPSVPHGQENRATATGNKEGTSGSPSTSEGWTRKIRELVDLIGTEPVQKEGETTRW